MKFLQRLSIRLGNRDSFKRSLIFAHEWAPHYNTPINLKVTTNIGKEYIVLYESVIGPFVQYNKDCPLSPVDRYEIHTRLYELFSRMERFGERIVDIEEVSHLAGK